MKENMQREIKFRTWNGNNMVDLYKTTPLALLPDLKIDGLFIPFGDEWKLMQFTGLKDKNGKEIYEGDIYEVAANKRYEVRYGNGGECNFEWYGGGFILFLNEEVFFPFDEFAMKNGKVIGNIYENPELVKSDKH